MTIEEALFVEFYYDNCLKNGCGFIDRIWFVKECDILFDEGPFDYDDYTVADKLEFYRQKYFELA